MSTVGDIVWADDNANGTQDSWEPRLSGITIQALDITGDLIAEDVTDNSGSYEIDYLQQEPYYFKVIAPQGLGVTVANTGSDDKDSDIDHSNGYNTTSLYNMISGEHIPNVDIGLIPSDILPVYYSAFRGKYVLGYNLLEWATLNESDNDRFEIERKFGFSSYEKIGEQQGNGTTSSAHDYSYKDFDVNVDGVYYYRLKQVDTNGDSRYSESIAIRVVVGDRLMVSNYPNPVTDLMHVSIQGKENRSVEIRIYDPLGKQVMYTHQSKLTGGMLSDELDMSILSQGVYLLNVLVGEEMYNCNFIKLNDK